MLGCPARSASAPLAPSGGAVAVTVAVPGCQAWFKLIHINISTCERCESGVSSLLTPATCPKQIKPASWPHNPAACSQQHPLLIHSRARGNGFRLHQV